MIQACKQFSMAACERRIALLSAAVYLRCMTLRYGSRLMMLIHTDALVGACKDVKQCYDSRKVLRKQIVAGSTSKAADCALLHPLRCKGLILCGVLRV